MSTKDGIVRAMTYDGYVRISAVVTTEAVGEAQRRHRTYPVATAALGRVMSSALLLSWGLKGEGNMTLRVLGDGPLGGIIVTANAFGDVKGYVQEPQVDVALNEQGKLDVGGAIGKGDLYVTKDIGLREAYTGSVALVSGEIGDDVAQYLLDSEQTPSLVAVGVLVNPDLSVAASGGIIIQAMPDAPEAILEELAQKLEGVQPVSTLVHNGDGPKELIGHYLSGLSINYLEEMPVQFNCQCGREKIGGLLKSLGQEELKDILAKEGQSEVICHFCNEVYLFERNELEGLLAELVEEAVGH